MGNTNTNNTSMTIEDVYEEDRALIQDATRAGGEATQTTRIGILGEELARRGAYGGQSPRIGILDEIEDEELARHGTPIGGRAGGEAGGGGTTAEEIARRGAYGGQSPRMGAAPALMDKINTSTPIEDRIRILSTEMIRRGLETEESFKRLRSYEKKRNEYRCLMEELARYYDRQTALGLPIERPVLKTGIYMQHVILL
jgi:hypothetical protein